MNGLEYRNLIDLAENRALTPRERLAVDGIIAAYKYGELPDRAVAEVAFIRACAARPSLRINLWPPIPMSIA
jgi:hypothetical protein